MQQKVFVILSIQNVIVQNRFKISTRIIIKISTFINDNKLDKFYIFDYIYRPLIPHIYQKFKCFTKIIQITLNV